MYTAAAALYPQALATSITLPMEILQAASQMASVRDHGISQVRFLLAGQACEPMTLSSGITLQPDTAVTDLPPLDLLLLPAIWRNPLPALRGATDWLGLLREEAAKGTRICSVGTGSYLLAEAGSTERQAGNDTLELLRTVQPTIPRRGSKESPPDHPE